MAAAKQGKGRWRGAEYADSRPRRCAMRQFAGDAGDGVVVMPGHDQRGQPSVRRPAAGLARHRFRFEEAIPITFGQCDHHRMVRVIGLQHDPARLFVAAGAASDLMQQLIGAFRRPQIAAGQAEIRIDHADQGQVWEMVSFCDDLGTDDDIDLVIEDLGNKCCGFGRSVDGIAGGDAKSRVRQESHHLFRQSLYARPAGDETVRRLAGAAGFRFPAKIAAMMALQSGGKAVFDKPRGAIGTFEPVPASAAKC